MKCFFGHKFGKVEPDGLQYCINCGKAIKHHPCKNGHIWKDTGEELLVKTVPNTYGSVNSYYVPQKCSVCGERRAVNQYKL